MGWPRCELCDCAALKSARAGSRQTVPRRALRKEPRSEFVLCFLNENEFEISNKLTWHVYLEVDQLVGPVVELVRQNAIEMVPAACVSSQTLQRPSEPAESDREYEALCTRRYYIGIYVKLH